jgi:hypothetical protein
MNKFMITAIKTCPNCKGEKMVYHPMWVAYWEEHGDGGRLKDHDYDLDWFQETYQCEPPDEEIPCSHCLGMGEIREETSLREALTEIELTAAIITAENRKAVLAKG